MKASASTGCHRYALLWAGIVHFHPEFENVTEDVDDNDFDDFSGFEMIVYEKSPIDMSVILWTSGLPKVSLEFYAPGGVYYVHAALILRSCRLPST